jgi:hypothetical protein
MKSTLLICSLLLQLAAWSQGTITGKVTDELTNEPIPFANIIIQNTTTGTTTDMDGNYALTDLKPGLYNLQVSFLGYTTKTLFDIEAYTNKKTILNISLAQSSESLDEVVIKESPYTKTAESPLSVKTVSANEIERYPGGNRDISRVIQSLPGVSTGLSFRNDIIVRGGSPNENRFFIDGIEIPTINHFSTQGASGGSNGFINVDFIKEVDFYSGAFPANRGNTLSSIMEFGFKEGRNDRIASRFTIGATEAGLSLEGPFSKKKNNTTFIASYRRSYQQLLFKVIGLPFLPLYNDAQFKIKTSFKNKSELIVLGIGAFDKFKLNLGANETEDQQYLLGFLPYFNQWNYTVGARYRKFTDKGNYILVASRTQQNNENFKYRDNENDNPDALLFRLTSNESENKLRYEQNMLLKGFKLNFGAGYEFAQYEINSTAVIPTDAGNYIATYRSNINQHKGALFGQVSRSFFNSRLSLSLGLRTDINSYNSRMSNPLRQLSPRFSASYTIKPGWNINFNTGRYYQLPPNTTLSYRDSLGTLTNKNTLNYIGNTQFVIGTDYTTQSNTRVSIEGFLKLYNNYPFLLDDSISLANLGAVYGVVGDAPANSNSDGRAYGFEVSVQQKLFKGFFGIASYTFAISEFTDKNGDYRYSSWDRRHVFSISLGKKFKRNWDIGTRFGLATGNPFTPYDVAYSSLISVWDVKGEAQLDFNQLNEGRNSLGQQWDIRVDKRWYFKKWSLNLYLDIRNVLNSQTKLNPDLVAVRDDNGNLVIDPNDPTRYKMKTIPSTDGLILPSLGIVIEL